MTYLFVILPIWVIYVSVKRAVFRREAGAGGIQTWSEFTENMGILHTFLLGEEVNDPRIPHTNEYLEYYLGDLISIF